MSTPRKLLYSLVFVICMAISYNCHAQTMHLILACDTNANNIGSGVQDDLNNMKYVFNELIDSEHLNMIVLDLEESGLEDILDKVESLDVDQNDTLMFYYSGHGAFNFNKGIQFLTLNSGDKIPRSTIAEALIKKRARLTIFLTDCCSIVQNIEEVRKSYTSKGKNKGIEKLFFQSRGFLDITSSRISEAALTAGMENYGSIFTYSFLIFIKSNAHNSKVEWKMMPKEVQTYMTKMFKSTNPTPVDLTEYISDDYPDWLEKYQNDQRMFVYSCPGFPKYRFGAAISTNSNNDICITRILKNTPAERCGLKKGDIILEINDKKIEKLKMVDVLIDISPQNMTMTVESDQKRRTVSVELTY